MAAKEVRFSTAAREKMLRGVDILADAERAPLDRRAAMCCSTSHSGRRELPRMASQWPKTSSLPTASRTDRASQAITHEGPKAVTRWI